MNKNKAVIITIILAVLAAFSACKMESDYITKLQEKVKNDLNPPPAATYTVTYDGNGNDGGSVPVDANEYKEGDNITVSNPSTLSLTGKTFIGWNTVSSGLGTGYQAGDKLAMQSKNIILYAQWSEDVYILTVTAGANGSITAPGTTSVNVGYGVPTTITAVPDSGYTFNGWSVVTGVGVIENDSLISTSIILNDGDAEVEAAFIDVTPPEAPVVNYLLTNDTTPTITWSRATGSTGNDVYKVQRGTSGWSDEIDGIEEYTEPTTLSEGSYTYFVQERDEAGNWSNSGSNSIVIDLTRPGAPTITWTTPAYDSTPTFTWTNGSGGAGIFRYQFESGTLYEEKTNTSYTHSSALSEGTYTFYVEVRDAAGNWCLTPASKEITISIPAPTTPSPADGNTSNMTDPDFDWSDVAGASIYKLQVGTNLDFTPPLLLDIEVGSSNYSWSQQLSEATTYYWRVRTRNSDGVYGSWSTKWDFTGEYKYGDTGPGGGIVFVNAYIEEMVFHRFTCEAAPSSLEQNSEWDAAITYCNNLTWASKTDWRCPDMRELTKIYNSLYTDDLGDIRSSTYWGSDTSGSYVWKYNFSTGTGDWSVKGRPYYVRPIRTISGH